MKLKKFKFVFFILVFLSCGFVNSYAQRTVTSFFTISSQKSQYNTGSGYKYFLYSNYPFEIDLYIFATNNAYSLIPIIRNEKKIADYLKSPNDILIFSSKITKNRNIEIFLPKYNNYKLIAISEPHGKKMVANIGGPCIDCGTTRTSIQLNENIRRENLTFANYDYDSAQVYIFDDNKNKLDFKGDNISLPYNSLLTDLYNYIEDRLIYSFNISRNSSYKFYLPEGKFHYTIFDPTSSSKISMGLDIPYQSPNYNEYRIVLSQKMPMKWTFPSTSQGLEIGQPKSQSSNSRVSKEEYEKKYGKTTMTILSEEEGYIEDNYKLIDLAKNNNPTIYYSKEMNIKTFEIVVPNSFNLESGNFFVYYWDGISDTEYKVKLKSGSNLFKGYSIRISCESQNCFGKLFAKDKQ